MSSSVALPRAGIASNAMHFIESVLKLFGVRIAMAAMEFSDARDAFLRLLLLGAIVLITSAFALLSISGMIVALAWEALGWRIFLMLFLVYFLVTINLLLKMRGIIASGKIGLPVTLAELKKDRSALFDELGDLDNKV